MRRHKLCKLPGELGTSTFAPREKSAALDPDVLADLEAACNAKGVVRDPELFGRITKRAGRAREETFQSFGDQKIGAEIFRSMHDE